MCVCVCVCARACVCVCWFPFKNSETVKAVTLQQHFIREIRARYGTPNSLQSLDIGKNSDVGISDFQIPDQSFVKENCYNSRTSNDIDMKLGAVTKLDKRNKVTSKKTDDSVMSANCDVIIIFPIYDQFGAIQKPDSRRMVCKTYIFIKTFFFFSKKLTSAK